MKRIAGMLIAGIICFGVYGMAFAGEGLITMEETAEEAASRQNDIFNLAALNMDELVSLRNAVLNEIYGRLGEDEPFASGVYIVGKDIKAGSYTITNLNTEDVYVYQIANIAVLPEGSSINDEDVTPLYTGRIKAQASFNVNLEDGMTLVLELDSGSMSIRSADAASWRP